MDNKAKKIIYGDEARQALKRGIDKIANAVTVTLGPRGRNVALDRSPDSPLVVNDGVTIAKAIKLKDPFENMGAQIVKEASSKTADSAGDGTTTSILLAQSMFTEGLRHITAGVNPMIMKQGMEIAVEKVVGAIKDMAKTIPNDDKTQVTQVATISSGSEKHGQIIAEAFMKVGKDGVITVEEGQGQDVEVEYAEGMEFDRGYLSPYFVTDQEHSVAEVRNPYILITDKKIMANADLLPLLEQLIKVTKDFVVICEDMGGEALATLVINKLKGTFNPLVVRAPGFGEARSAMLEDIAALTGATVINDALGRSWESVTIADCGKAGSVWSDKDTCRIIGGKGQKEAIDTRIAQIKGSLNKKDISQYVKEQLEERLAKLTGGVAVIKVGAATEVDMRDKKERIVDAVSATKAALEEGIVPGGGVALLKVRRKLEGVDFGTSEGSIGMKIVYEALSNPLAKIAENAGQSPDVVVNKVEDSTEKDFGFDALTLTYGSMYEKGIVDPVKVVRSALQNAASVTAMALSTECLITDEEEKKPQHPQMNPYM